MKNKLTESHLRTKTKPKSAPFELRDGGGLSLVVYPTGARSWRYDYTTASGKRRRLVLGEYPAVSLADARVLHKAAHEQVRAGLDPMEEQRVARETAEAQRAEEETRRAAEDLSPTVEKLVETYLAKWARNKRTFELKKTWAEDKRQLEKDVVPVLGKLKARDVTRGQIRALLDTVVDRGAPVSANRLLAVVQRMFAAAVEKEIIPVSPCQGLNMPALEEPRDRVLTPDEIRAFWQAMESLPAPIVRKGRPRTARRAPGEPHGVTEQIRRALKLVLITGQRPGEIAGMTWEEIEGYWWTIPAERAKNGQSHRVHLSKLAFEVLGTRGTGYVFPSPRKAKGPIHRSALAHSLRDNREALGGAAFSPHDLRRTAASLMAGAGVSPFTVERVLNHSLGKVQKIYNRHSYDREKRQALDSWGRTLAGIVAGEVETADNVVEFTAAG